MEKEVRTKFTTLYIDPTVLKKIMYYTQAADGEVSGLGTILKDERGRHVVNKVFLLEQEASGADTELKPEAISTLMVDMMKKNEDPAALKFWFHSHANMGVFWSGTDDSCAETLSKEYAFSLVVNKSGERRCRLDLYNPFRITFDGIRVEELIQEDETLKKICEQEVKEKVKSPYERYQNWREDNDYSYNNGYFHNNQKNGLNWRGGNQGKSRVDLPENIVEDIEALIQLASDNQKLGGIQSPEVWEEFIISLMKKTCERRFEKKANCGVFATYMKGAQTCIQCKTAKQCEFWTKYFEETEEDTKDIPYEQQSTILIE